MCPKTSSQDINIRWQNGDKTKSDHVIDIWSLLKANSQHVRISRWLQGIAGHSRQSVAVAENVSSYSVFVRIFIKYHIACYLGCGVFRCKFPLDLERRDPVTTSTKPRDGNLWRCLFALLTYEYADDCWVIQTWDAILTSVRILEELTIGALVFFPVYRRYY